ncbi:MAG: cobalamin-binding protein [Fuerstiella sp.]|nr:cobalamin-binding protein [Fuerstiella sp.]MCP4854869.1 cobalamin-binding protein [Fuerstiella sp.]
MSQSTPDLEKLYEAILAGDAATAADLTQQAIDAEIDAQTLITERMIPAMDEVGRRFEVGEFFVPELLISGRAMKGALDLLRPLLAAQGVEPVGRVVIGTVKGDLHDIGKGLVASMLEGAGFDVVDLGVDVSADRFVSEVRDSKANVLALSALLTTTMPAMKGVIEAMQGSDVSEQCKVMIGGAPITQQYADVIGADGYSESAAGAVSLARALVLN